jgi:pimeloyl-ACP methyl ester carboxylesterase
MRPLTRFVAASLLIATLIGGCGKPGKSDPSKPPSIPSVGWISKGSSDHKIAVVYIHGIFGDAVGTWTGPGGKTFFDYIKDNPAVGAKVDQYAFGFTTDMLKAGSVDVNQASEVLHQRLQFDGVLSYPRIVLVSHSMGGLIAMRYLLRHPETLQRVPLMVDYATPQEGADIAHIAQLASKNPALVNLTPADGNGFLQQLDGDWKALPKRPYLSCAFEMKPTYGIWIVRWASSTRFCNEAGIAIAGADHLTIVKPDKPDHDSVIVLVNALERFVTGQQLATKIDMPDFAPEGDHFVYQLRSFGDRGNARLVNAGGSATQYTIGLTDHFLEVTPYPTPRPLSVGGMEQLSIALLWGASSAEYPFVLKAEGIDDRKVIVRVDQKAYNEDKSRVFGETLSEVGNALSNPETLAKLAATPRDSDEASKAVVDIVKRSAAKRWPDRPEYEHSLFAAEVLSAANWPQIAAVALRDAESRAPHIVEAPAIRTLAARVASASGRKVFERDVKPIPVKPLSEADPWQALIAPAIIVGNVKEPATLAANMEKIPALQASAYTFGGDVKLARGNVREAQDLYRKAGDIEPSPQITERQLAVMRHISTNVPESKRSYGPPPGESAAHGVRIDSLKAPRDNKATTLAPAASGSAPGANR